MQAARIISVALMILTLAGHGQTWAAEAEGYRLARRSAIYEVPSQRALDLTDEVTLEAATLDRCFSPERFLENADIVFDRLEQSHLVGPEA